MFNVTKVEAEIGGKTLSIETGRMARQAHGAVLVTYGETVAMVTATAEAKPKVGLDFFPLTVMYQTKGYAAGMIPGGFFKREGRPHDSDTLTARLIDRPIRPLFPKAFKCETQVIVNVLSHDCENIPDVLGMVGTGAALSISNIPFDGPVAGVRVGFIDSGYVINPTKTQLEDSDLDLIVAGSRDAVMMVESGCKNLSEDQMLGAIEAGHVEIKKIIAIIDELVEKVGKEKRVVEEVVVDEAITDYAEKFFAEHGQAAYAIPGKKERSEAVSAAKAKMVESLSDEQLENVKEYKEAFGNAGKNFVREQILESGKRIDGRSPSDIRAINCGVGELPRTHGSALFTRGETQALCLTTLGTSRDEQLIDVPDGSYYKKFMLHYNFPPFSVGEARPLRGPGRREIGHGALAERALKVVLPEHEQFPYTIRLVSEVLESNGSSSMASICGGSLALMDAGVPIKAPVAGIAMGLITDGKRNAVLSDILGDEDHLGDMDFKVAGTREGITALQMDIKVKGLPVEIMKQALDQAREGRLHILNCMDEALTEGREDLSPHAPRIVVIHVNTEKIKDVIGPGGKNIRKIIEETQTTIDIQDDGSINIGSPDGERTERAIKMIRDLTQEAEVGKIYDGIVRSIKDFGAVVEIYAGNYGIVHISEIAEARIDRDGITKYMKEGDTVKVKCLNVDQSGRIKLSRKAAMKDLGLTDPE